MSGTPPQRRDAAIDGLRGLMLLIIVVTHYVPTGFFSANIARPAAAIMLTVTGYFLMARIDLEAWSRGGVLDRARLAVALLRKRHRRIWPAMAGVVGLYLLLGLIDGHATTRQIFQTWPLYLVYGGNIVKMMFEGQAFPAHFWLISAQEQFVLLVLILLVLASPTRVASLLKFAIVLGVVSRLVGCALWMPAHPSLATETPFAVADALSLGMLCNLAIRRGTSKTRLKRQCLTATLALFFLWATVPNSYAAYFGLAPLLTALIGCRIILTMADDVAARRLHQTFLGWPFLVLLGQMSLSLFLIHPLVNTVVNLSFARLTGQLIPWWALIMTGPPLSLAAAWAYFRAVEKPIGRRRPPAANRNSYLPNRISHDFLGLTAVDSAKALPPSPYRPSF